MWAFVTWSIPLCDEPYLAPILYWKGKILGKAFFFWVRISLLNFIGWCFADGILSIVNAYIFCLLYLSAENTNVYSFHSSQLLMSHDSWVLRNLWIKGLPSSWLKRKKDVYKYLRCFFLWWSSIEVNLERNRL